MTISRINDEPETLQMEVLTSAAGIRLEFGILTRRVFLTVEQALTLGQALAAAAHAAKVSS